MTGARKFGIVTFGAILIALFVIIGLAQGIGRPSVQDGDIALVQDVEGAPDNRIDISQKQYDRAFIQAWKRAGLKVSPKRRDAQYKQVHEGAISDLLDQAWLNGEAAELGINASDREIEAELTNIRNQQFPDEAAFDKFLKESGFNMDEVKDRVRLQVLSNKIQEKITGSIKKADESDIEQAYEANKQAFTTPATRDIRLIVTDSEKRAEAAKQALGENPDEKTFAKVAKEYSTHASKSQGGETVATEGAFPDPAGSDIMKATKDQLEGPIKAGDQFYIFSVTKITDEKVQPLEKVRDQIEQQVLPTLQQKAMQDFVSDYNAKWKSRTVCADGYVISRCSNFKGDGRPQDADPACYKPGAGKKAAAGKLACPAPVGLWKPLAPGSNATASGLGQQAQALPQGPIPAGDSTKAPAAGAGGAGALGGVTGGAASGAAGGSAAAQAAAAQAAAAQAAAQAGGQ
ncbi:MAG: peptidyl-prolyl cis-trans isomerase [Solirubrobacterales bacterium]|nr:peptidyl-prolyl cis-trans isomerase [Solirubrobacterales bacterium]